MELLTNAVKFAPKGGRIQVLLKRVNSHVELSVSDNGAGISPEFLPYVFDQFRQSDQSTTRRFDGLSLGLAIVKHLVELHGGTVRAKSAGEGQVATFVITLALSLERRPLVRYRPGRQSNPRCRTSARAPTCADSGRPHGGVCR